MATLISLNKPDFDISQYVQNNKESDNDWFRLESNKEGTRWFGKCWYIHELLKYEFDVEFDVGFYLFFIKFFFKHNFCVKPYVTREPRRDPSNRRLIEHGIYIRHCQESSSQPVPSQAGADTTRPR